MRSSVGRLSIEASDLIDYVKKRFTRAFPGYLQTLDYLFKSRHGLNALQMFFYDSVEFYKTVREHYGIEDVALFVVTYLVKTVLIRLNRLDLLDEAVRKAVSNSKDFKELLEGLGVRY